MKLYLLLVFKFLWTLSIQIQPQLTIDEFFNATYFPSSSLSPNGRYLLVHSRHPAWESNKFENNLWLYETQTQKRKLITNELSNIIKPKWSPSGNLIVFLIDKNSSDDDQHIQRSIKSQPKIEQYLQLYNIISEDLLSISTGTEMPLAITWSKDDNSLYFSASMSSEKEDNDNSTLNEVEWKDVIRYRQPKASDSNMIHRIDISRRNRRVSVTITPIKSVSFSIGELLFAASENKLLLTSVAAIVENVDVLELYSLDLRNLSNLTRLTTNEGPETNLQLSPDGKHVFFQIFPLSSRNEGATQLRLYSIDLTNGQTERWGKGFQGSITGYTIRSEGGIYMLGQLGTNVQIYIQQSSSRYSILQDGWNGTYQAISSSSLKGQSSIAFTYSSFERPEEIYFINSIEQLQSAKAITNENHLLTQRNLPKGKVYKWINDEDDLTIEGILHYPPEKFEHKNLPLLVLIHGGPTDASLNSFHGDWYNWAPMAATQGWLVLEPNYRGSTGYGDQFVSEIVSHPLYRPGRDIISGVDRLIKDGIADPNKLAIGGFSYGGILTNWLITQTTRFNAALSGAGLVEHVLMWGRSDIPVFIKDIVGGFPWEVPQKYLNESPIYQLNKVCTPTHIVTGQNDIRVPADHNYILERGLHYLGVPVKLLVFPNEGHSLSNNPWHGKIKVREELKWLEKYGHTSSIRQTN